MFDIDYDALARQTQKIDEEIQSTFDEMADDRETALNALLEVPKQLESVNQKLDVEQEAREKSEQEAKKRDSRTFWISLFTLIVAVISLAGGCGQFLGLNDHTHTLSVFHWTHSAQRYLYPLFAVPYHVFFNLADKFIY